MRVRAPGKLVLSGAYAVLTGAPCLVAAVDRYVVVDTARAPERVTGEVAAAMARGWLEGPAWFDASALRDTEADRKLGLGSSAAILVATLGAAAHARGERDLAAAVFPRALAAHRAAQGGGSGVDVAASCHGGIVRCQLDVPSGAPFGAGEGLSVGRTALPHGTEVVVLVAAASAHTSSMLAAVRALEADDRSSFVRCLTAASEGAAAAATASSTADLVDALRAQLRALAALGLAAGVPIVTEAVAALDRVAETEGGVVLPSGAGGGDVALFVGPQLPSAEVVEASAAHGLRAVKLGLGARGVHVEEAS